MRVAQRVGRTLGHGRFFGKALRAREVDGFALADLRPVLRAEEVETHRHVGAHFVLVLHGEYVSTAQGATPVSRGPVLIYNPPGTEHRDHFHSLDGRFLTISISAEALKLAGAEVCLPDAPTAYSGLRSKSAGLRIFQAFSGDHRATGLDLEGHCLGLLRLTAIEPDEATAHKPGWLNGARDFLHDRCAGEITIREVAAAVGVHPIHLARTFRSFFRATPGEYLRTCRLEKAAALLTDTRKTLAEVSLESGFYDQSHLSRAFRTAFGLTPRHYRKGFESSEEVI